MGSNVQLVGAFDRITYLVFFGFKNYHAFYNSVIYFLSQKIGIAYIISPNYTSIEVDSHNSLPLEKTLTFHNVIILIKFQIKITITPTIVYFSKNLQINNISMLYYDRTDVYITQKTKRIKIV